MGSALVFRVNNTVIIIVIVIFKIHNTKPFADKIINVIGTASITSDVGESS